MNSQQTLNIDSETEADSVESFTIDLEEPINVFSLEGYDYPAVVSGDSDSADIYDWLERNRGFVEEQLLQKGALLFRGFRLAEKERFERFAAQACNQLIGNYADLPEESGTDVIYGSTPYPEDKTIYFHNESSHLNQWPTKQFFACVTPSHTGGETPIVDCRVLYKELPQEFLAKCKQHGLLYIRNFIPGLDVSWQDFFKTESKADVELACQAENMQVEWGEFGRLKISKRVDAIKKHPVTGEDIFFNQIQLHHPNFLNHSERESLIELFGEEGLPRNVRFGDGSIISDEIANELYDACVRNCVKFNWQKGDLLMVDNRIIAHARLPFKGERKILVAMGDLEKSI
ncbi:TauD/TfdA family dioxygenase [Aliikangiella sp. G2MR2-5]|uniref:TauD/TfdA family dioxygenase n=1 Tax=Aliikangiella sp. G2MR2-5 TaxID=2788943 RepID=UPI0018AA40DB|nr:TauD/TfdA family dioxygenase [Aliikangiella sp. G2MR2-5]